MKKLITVLLAFCLVFGMGMLPTLASEADEIVGYSSARVEKKDLTAVPNLLDYENVAAQAPAAYQITDAAGVCKLSTLVNSGKTFEGIKVYLANDIDMTGVTDFEPIAKNANLYFKGVFDGQGHIIEHLKLTNSKAENVALTGLFGNVISATIKNLVLGSNCEIKYTGTSGDARTAAIVANINQNVTVDNVYSMAAVIGVRYTGGIVGFVNQAAESKTIVNCTNTGAVTGRAGVGGIVGMVAYANTAVRNCRNTGAVTCTAEQANGFNIVIGGIVGRCWADQLVIDGCINNGAISCVDVTGGILGAQQLKNVTVTNCINYGTMNGAEQGLCGKIADGIAVTDTGSQNLAGEEDPTLSTVEIITPSFPSAYPAVFHGYQLQNIGADATTRSIRFVASIDSLDYSAVGFHVVAKGTLKNKDEIKICEYVYSSLSGMNGDEQVTYQASDLRPGGYLFALSLQSVPLSEGEIEFEITPFYVKDGQTVNCKTSLFTCDIRTATDTVPAQD